MRSVAGVFLGLLSVGIGFSGLTAARGADETVEFGPYPDGMFWPLSGSEKPDVPLAHTFGPRKLMSENFRTDFCRGMDLLAKKGTPVHAVAAGEVRIAGEHPSYKQPLVQIKHGKSESGENCKGAGCFYTQYMYLSDTTVKAGDHVERGQLIGHSGLSPNRFERLHFELRDGGTSQKYSVHPLAALPYENKLPPDVEIKNVDVKDREKTTVTVNVRCATEEADLNRVEVQLYDGEALVDRQAYDLTDWNRRYTPTDGSDDPLEATVFQGVAALPDTFNASATQYWLDLTFSGLKPAPNPRAAVVKVSATDIRGQSAEAVFPKPKGKR